MIGKLISKLFGKKPSPPTKLPADDPPHRNLRPRKTENEDRKVVPLPKREPPKPKTFKDEQNDVWRAWNRSAR